MKTVLLFLQLLPCILLAQKGKLIESVKMYSTIMNDSVAYSIYLPSDYNSSQRSYPTLYLLHGYTDNETGWTQYGEIQEIVDAHHNDPDITEMIIAMPDGGVTWYINSFDGNIKYEDFFINEFIPYIDNNYRTRTEKQFRAISGLSMGGYGSFNYALKYPELFSACAPLSAAVNGTAALIAMEQDDYDRIFGFLLGTNLSGKDRVNEFSRNQIVPEIIKHSDPEPLKTIRWYIDCGDDDFLINGNMEVSRLMREKGIKHEFRVRDGAHTWSYWRSALPEVLRFISISFHR